MRMTEDERAAGCSKRARNNLSSTVRVCFAFSSRIKRRSSLNHLHHEDDDGIRSDLCRKGLVDV